MPSFRYSRYVAVLAVFCLISLSASPVLAAPGDLDTTFNGTGKVRTDVLNGSFDFGNAVAIQPDGKIIVAGISDKNQSAIYDFAVMRYNRNGTLDTTFNGTGKIVTPVSPFDDYAQAVALQPDGKIVVAGWLNTGANGDDFAVVRYNTDGSLDTTFNGTGIVTTPINNSNHDQALAVAVQPDGKIVAAGFTINSTYDFALVRYNTNGSLDTTFNGTGKVVTPVGSDEDVITGMALQPDGKIVAVGWSYNGTDYDFAVVRYNTDGSLDTTFNGTGIVTTPIGGGTDQARAVAIQFDGKIIVAGNSVNNSANDFALARYNTNGSLDTSFNGTGKVTTAIGSSQEQAFAVATQPDGKIVAAGYSFGGINAFAVVRYNTSGSLDTTFHGTGIVTTAVGSDDQVNGVAIQPDGKIVAAGYSFNGNDYDFAVARYQAFTVPNRTSNFDADLLTDISIWNPTNHNWYIIDSTTSQLRTIFDWGSGALGDIAVPGDYDGDGKTDLAVWRPSEGNWYVVSSITGLASAKGWGGSTDKPVPGDYDGDGKTDFAIFRPSEGNWYILNSRDNSVTIKGWGAATDKLVPADYDGDGRTDIAVYRPGEGNWYIITSKDGFIRLINWGAATDKLVPADYDGDGRVDVAVFRPSEGNWYIRLWAGSVILRGWGASTDIPVPADYDGDGKADIAVWRPSEGNWYIINSSTNAMNIQYLGGNEDVPVPSAYLPQ